MKILAIDPGSTSTKIGVFTDDTLIFSVVLRHSREELAQFSTIMEQLNYREQLVVSALQNDNIPIEFDVIVGRGGLVSPIEGGVYEVNHKLIAETEHPLHNHACNLGALIANNIANKIPNCRAFIADPPVVDELDSVARITGLPDIKRESLWHALNQKAIARRYAKEIGTKYEALNLVVVHIGGGISIAAHKHGRAVDTNNALSGDGAFSPERAGTVPVNSLIDLCYSGKYTRDEMINIVTSHSGLLAHLGTNDILHILERINKGDMHAKLILDAMIYQVAKGIGAYSTVLCGRVDAILLTGQIAHSQYITSGITERVGFIAPVKVYAGEDELTALASNALAAIHGELPIKQYGE